MSHNLFFFLLELHESTYFPQPLTPLIDKSIDRPSPVSTAHLLVMSDDMSIDVPATPSFLSLPEEILLLIFSKHYASTEVKVKHTHLLKQHRVVKRKRASKIKKPVYVRPFTQECLDALLISKVTYLAAMEAFLQQAKFHFKMMEGGNIPGVLHALETNQTIRTMSGDLDTSRALCVHQKYFGRHGRVNLKRFLLQEHATARIDLNQIGRSKFQHSPFLSTQTL